MTSALEKERAATGLRRCADDLNAAFDGLVAASIDAWDCPAARVFEAAVRERTVVLDDVATGLRSSAARLEAEAAAERAAAAEAAVGVDPSVPVLVGGGAGSAPPPPQVVVGGPR